VDAVLNAGVIHFSHHLIFHACNSQVIAIARAQKFDYAFLLIDYLIKSLEYIATPNHVQYSVFYDMKAQMLLATGKLEEAKAAYKLAYENRVLTCGKDTEVTEESKRKIKLKHAPSFTNAAAAAGIKPGSVPPGAPPAKSKK